MRLKKFKVKGNKIQGRGKDDIGEFEFNEFTPIRSNNNKITQANQSNEPFLM